MTNKERIFRPDYAHELLRIAKSDLHAAQLLAATKQARPETVFFHVQQAIEKSLKAVLCQKHRPVPMVHDIGALLGKLTEPDFPPHGYDLMDFNDYAGIRRYEEGEIEFTDADMAAAIKIGQDVIDWANLIVI